VDGRGRVRPLDWEPFRPLLAPLPFAAWLHRHSVAAYVAHKRLLSASAQHRAYAERWRTTLPEAAQWTVLADRLADLGADRKLVVVAIPTREQVADGDTAFARRLGRVAERIGCRLIDLQPVLRSGHFFARHDFHWNPVGHRVVADRLAAATW
jgi:hypothetical protein